MNETVKRQILLEYFDTVSYIMSYEWNDEFKKIAVGIIGLLADIYGVPDAAEECTEMTEKVANLQTVQDIALMAGDEIASSVAFTVKASYITANDIRMQRIFDHGIAVMAVKRAAEEGERSACRLWACMNWLGSFPEADRRRAVEVWKTLAASCEISAVKALVYAYGVMGDTAERDMWAAVGEALENASRNFLPLVLPDGNDRCGGRAVMLADLILAAAGRRNTSAEASRNIDRAMAYYILYCDGLFEEKLARVSSQGSFYPLVWECRRFENSKFGF